ncbi:MAG: oligosaccharide flippase family protein [Chloroflexi bacterium]|nr:oligosaccharide flippase family protein [Chloroflexota bacterium]
MEIVARLQGTAIRAGNAAYRRVFHEDLPESVRQFIGNSSFVFWGMSFSALSSFILNLIAGRALGPSGYGEFALFTSIGSVLLTPIAPLSTPMVKYSAEQRELQGQSRVISTTFVLLLILCPMLIGIYFFLSPVLSAAFSVSQTLFYFAMVLFAVTLLNSFTMSILYGLMEMKNVGIFTPLPTIISLAVLALQFAFTRTLSFSSVALSILAGNLVVDAIVLFLKRKYISLTFSRPEARRLVRYGSYALWGAVFSVITTQTSKLLINRYMSTADVGTYNAYYFASVNAAWFIMLPLAEVLFPTACRQEDKSSLFRRINKIVPPVSLMTLPAIVLIQYIVLSLYGKGYTFDLKLAVLFALLTVLSSLYLIYGRLMNSVGTGGAKVTSAATVAMGLVLVPLSFLLIPVWGVAGAVIPLIVAYSAYLVFILWKRGLFSYQSDETPQQEPQASLIKDSHGQ